VEEPNSEGTGIIGADTTDPARFLMIEHKEGKHSGRRANGLCPHCRELEGRCPGCGAGEDVPHLESCPVFRWLPSGVNSNTVSPQPGTMDQEEALRTLWNLLNLAEQDKVIPKAVEYGAADLDIMGFALGVMLNSDGARDHEWTSAELQEMACWFYELGKVARAFGAMAHGRIPNADTPHDAGVYARIIQVIRERGKWM